MLRVTVFVSAVLLSVLATASPHGSTFVAGKRQVAIVTGAAGHRSLSVTVSGDPALGAGTQADCELRAVESHRSWHLVPFTSDTMGVGAKDLQGVQFSVKPMGERAFRIDTDFDEKFCAAGLSFAGTYRKH
jgi:hypothetical protein